MTERPPGGAEPAGLRCHHIHLHDDDLVLRPLTEDDWPLLLAWHADPEVPCRTVGGGCAPRSLAEVQRTWRAASQSALTFVVEVAGRPIGDCWLQRMNLRRILTLLPGLDCRRIDLTIGVESLRGHGYGSRAIRLLTHLAFDLDADAVFAVDVADHNWRGRRAFERAGYQVFAVADAPQPATARRVYDLVAWRDAGAAGAAASGEAPSRSPDAPDAHGRPDPRNELNDLTGTQWAAFTKSWLVHNPPPRSGSAALHPAKFPETLIAEFVEFFTKRHAGHVILDPFLGTGSALVAVDLCNRRYGGDRAGIGIELSERYAAVARARTAQRVICADALSFDFASLYPVHFAITSPPYWDVLHKDTGKLSRLRESQGLETRYSDEAADLGNEHDYDAFLSKLVRVSQGVQAALVPGKFYVVILSDTNKRERYYPMAFDFAQRLQAESSFVLKGVKLWCQDNKRLLPYGYPYSFVPNFLHHYCLIFRKP